MQNDNKSEKVALGNKAVDYLTASLRGVFGIVPFAGPALNEVITCIIPNQRMERFEKYILYLSEELQRLNIEMDHEYIKWPENANLLEEGLYYALEAFSDKRIRYIARCIAEGIVEKDLDKTKEKRILRLLSQVDDEEIMLLYAFADVMNEKGLMSKLRPLPAAIGSPPDVIDNNAFYTGSLKNLESLGLVKTAYSFVKKGQSPEWDSMRGQFKGGHTEVTRLGHMLLKKIEPIESSELENKPNDIIG